MIAPRTAAVARARTPHPGLLLAVAIVGLALSLPAYGQAAGRRVSVDGRVAGGAGMTLLAVAPDGSAVRATLDRKGRFRVALPAATARDATLQLVHPSGSYFGPVVLASSRGRSYLALGGKSVDLGTLALRASWAVATRPLPASKLDATLFAAADGRGKPLGAGRLGLVRTPAAQKRKSQGVRGLAAALDEGQGSQSGHDGAGGDPDGDGIPNLVDADDNGNLVLDAVDPVSAQESASNAGLFSTLFLGFEQALNANAAGVTQQAIDAAIAGENMFGLVFYFDEARFSGRTITGAHVDCFTLLYCRPGDGTAILGGVSESSPSLPRGSRWVEYNPDGSGYPNLERIDRGDGSPAAWVAGVGPRVATADIRPGDMFSVVFGSDAGPITIPTSLSGYFVTTPAILSYASGGAATAVSYPVPAAAPGTRANPLVLSATQLTLTFWGPQRAAIPGAESGSYIDMGHLRYGVVPSIAGASGEFGCSGFYSSLSPTLSEVASSSDPATDLFPLRDSAGDAAPDLARTLSFAVDLGECLAARGIDPTGLTLDLTLTAASEPRPGGMDRAAQTVSVRLPG